jgi:hypothetical protein
MGIALMVFFQRQEFALAANGNRTNFGSGFDTKNFGHVGKCKNLSALNYIALKL